ncbi:hypothetical protein GW796_07390 [archaeon]|nr:hypothetical protein [archaeon]NCQ51707.1 hypothetical protein [archaeon]
MNIINKQKLVLWHGGRDLEFEYRKAKMPTKGRWEHGPGLYLTTHYETAKQYAKGGGKTYNVEFELGNDIKNIYINLDSVLSFVKDYAIRKKQNDVIKDIHNNMKRLNLLDKVGAEVVLNLLFNYDAIKGKNVLKLNEFLVENNVDYGVVTNFSGRDEIVFVLFNLKKINKVVPISSKDVLLSDFEIKINYNNEYRKNKISI